MKSILKNLPRETRDRLRKRRHPSWTVPMLATLTHEHFSDENWLFERKLDGERALAFRRGRKVTLLSRNRKPLNDNYPEIAEALPDQRAGDFVIDGEIVAFKGKLTSFARLQKRMQVSDPDRARRSRVAVFLLHF